MRFCDFLNIMYDNSHNPSKELYVAQLFSALCGESEPFTANVVYSGAKKNSSTFSSKLPSGLSNPDPTYRRRLYKGEDINYKGLSLPIRNHMQRYGNENKITFINFLEKSVRFEIFSNLCADFEVLDSVDRLVMFESIYAQFMKFAYSPNDDVECIVPDKARELSMNRTKSTATVMAFQDEPPIEQMLKIFNKAIGKYSIANFICEEITFSSKVIGFIEAIQCDILSYFIDSQNEGTYQNISKFSKSLNIYNRLLNTISPSILNWYIGLLNHYSSEHVISLINEDRDRSAKKKDKLELLLKSMPESEMRLETNGDTISSRFEEKETEGYSFVETAPESIIDSVLNAIWEEHRIFITHEDLPKVLSLDINEMKSEIIHYVNGNEFHVENPYKQFSKLESEVMNLCLMEKAVVKRQQIDSLYGKICDSKTLLVY